MTYSQAKRAEYPDQDEASLLAEFTAELLARRKFAETGHPGTTFDDWIGSDDATRQERMEKFRAHANSLAALGMLSWPTIETPDVGWAVEGPGQIRGMKAAPALDWVQPFGRNAKRAITYFRACRTTGQPCRLSWAFSTRKNGLSLG
ncbi:hypothetical protein [Pseudarthrobacter sp. BIM B-2242]|uniref:hypothetical protein n=1 Tax=Pseudarthrobacter sp. BIM B-2242 TaxID=2772401 RepID=UPI00168B036C|nr:hypothetical protein [Pseudarthrobacter sp. BIM B-2242]QOD05865.1 hypothetical protein IDT60_23020 [Pseudarthrobacter sp. BIM B-2242]